MSSEELLQHITLTLVPQIGDVHLKTLLRHFGSATAIMKASRRELECLPGIGSVRASAIRKSRDLTRAEREVTFMLKYGIIPLPFGTPDYPVRLQHCHDAPALLYFKGNGRIHDKRILSIVGTRAPSHYGKDWLATTIEEIAPYSPLIVSGLAYGIDTIAHRQALKSGLNTIGVLAHGLDRIYPHANKTLAREMTAAGGLLTEFMSGTLPDAQHFPQRNRIVAGLADGVLVVETGRKGGSMITADLANSYHRDVFALPGRVTDEKSSGCLKLIQEHRAQAVTCAQDIIEALNWDHEPQVKKTPPPTLFPEPDPDEKLVIDLLQQRETWPLDELLQHVPLQPSEIAAALLRLEMNGRIHALPGKRYRLS
jgi:DNA processing protein